jgi:hypothetical protein
MIINGGMDVWQRGDSFALSGGWIHTADCWRVLGSTGTTISRSTDVPPGVPVTSSIKFTAFNSSGLLRSYVEGSRLGINHTLSAWVKGPAGATGSFDISDVGGKGIIFTGDWQYISNTVFVPTDNVIAFGNILRNVSLPGDYYATAVTLTPGEFALPYAPEAGEIGLIKCRSRFERIGFGAANAPLSSSVSVAAGATYLHLSVPIVPKRANPSVALYDPSNYVFHMNRYDANAQYLLPISAISAPFPAYRGGVLDLYVTLASATTYAGTGFLRQVNGAASPYIDVSADI